MTSSGALEDREIRRTVPVRIRTGQARTVRAGTGRPGSRARRVTGTRDSRAGARSRDRMAPVGPQDRVARMVPALTARAREAPEAPEVPVVLAVRMALTVRRRRDRAVAAGSHR